MFGYSQFENQGGLWAKKAYSDPHFLGSDQVRAVQICETRIFIVLVYQILCLLGWKNSILLSANLRLPYRPSH